jgi:tetratricopeptide (TPR) repeat protein
MSPRGFEFGFNESWGVAEALRDYALRSGDFAKPMALLRERFHLPVGSPPKLTLGNYRAAVPLAQLELVRGNEASARDLLQAVVRYLDDDVQSPPVYKRRSRSQALMLLGDPDAALAELEASFRKDRDYTQWWYAIDRDPVWDPLRGSDRFRALAGEVRAYATSERGRVDELRREGKIPARPATTGPGATSTARRE